MSGRGRSSTTTRSGPRRTTASATPEPQQALGAAAATPISRTRRTRSQSADLDQPQQRDATTAANMTKSPASTKRRARTARQGSVDSVASTDSNVSATTRGRKKATARVKAATTRDLSIVTEDKEAGEGENMEDSANKQLSQEFEQHRRSRAPSQTSQMSGTTAAEVDYTLMVESLPDLLDDASKLLEILAPVDVTQADVQEIVTELQIIDSHLAKKLRHAEKRFSTELEPYGEVDYIKPSVVVSRLFGNQDPGYGPYRPDPVLQVANLATLVKDLMPSQREIKRTYLSLQNIDLNFPELFIAGFDKDAQLGRSALLDETFEMGLDIRTQFAIAGLLVFRGEPGWEPELTLDLIFGTSGGLKPISGMNAEMSGQHKANAQALKIQERVDALRSSFEEEDEALDYASPEKLEALFPWSQFLTSLAHWSRIRFGEIKQTIQQQGGIANIKRQLGLALESMDNQTGIVYKPPKSSISVSRSSLPPPPTPKFQSSSQSLNNPTSVKMLKNLRKSMSLVGQPATPQPSVQSKPQATEPARLPDTAVPNEEPPSNQLQQDKQPATSSFGRRSVVRSSQPQPSVVTGSISATQMAEYLDTINEHLREKNKENRPILHSDSVTTGKRSFFDRQENAKKTQWDTQDSNEESDPQPKRPRRKEPGPEPEPEPEFESEPESEGVGDVDIGDEDEEGFEEDRRAVNHAQRAAAQARTQNQPGLVQKARPAKESGTRESQQRRVQRPIRQASVDVQSLQDAETALDVGDDISRPLSTQISVAARTAAAHCRPYVNQKRTPWSETDTQHLIDGIELVGCKWSEITAMGGFEHERDQVALKDKARNIKVQYLRGGVRLPVNFENVALGKKEIASIRAVHKDYNPEDEE